MLNQLREIGLSENEAKVYLAMLELGSATDVQIETLKRRGLIEALTKGKKSFFTAKDPSQLGAMLERQSKEIEVNKIELEKVMPQLQTMWDLAGKKPVVHYYEGIDGLRQMQNEFLKCKEKKILAFASLDKVIDVFPKQLESYSPRRIAKGISSRLLYTSLKGPVLERESLESLRSTRYLNTGKLPFTSDITIYDDSIAITSLVVPLSGTIITHKDIAISFKSLFELI